MPSWSQTNIAAAIFTMTQTISKTLIEINVPFLLFGSRALSRTSFGKTRCHQNLRSTLHPPPDLLHASAACSQAWSLGMIWPTGVTKWTLSSCNSVRKKIDFFFHRERDSVCSPACMNLPSCLSYCKTYFPCVIFMLWLALCFFDQLSIPFVCWVKEIIVLPQSKSAWCIQSWHHVKD